MATLSYDDIKKRDNINVLLDRVSNKGSFRLNSFDGTVLVSTGKIRMQVGGIYSNIVLKDKTTADKVLQFLNTKKQTDKIEIEVIYNRTRVWKVITSIFKDDYFGGKAPKTSASGSERQELGLIEFISKHVVKGNNYFITSFGRNKKIKEISKYNISTRSGSEPYTDVVISTYDNNSYRVSMKGKTAPSLAGGGLEGIKSIAPELVNKMYVTILKYIKDIGLHDGSIVNADLIPDIFIRIPDKYVKTIVAGNVSVGGPIDYMYIGEMNVAGTVDDNTGEMRPNGDFYSVDEYIKKIPTFYFRIRKRDLQQDNKIQIATTRKNTDGYPMIFVGPTSRKNNFRLVITSELTTTGKLLTIE